MIAKLVRIENEAPNISTFYFRPEKPLKFKAGQYAELTLRHDGSDKRGEKRLFTLSSSPTDYLVSITNKFSPKDGSTFKAELLKLKPGDEVAIGKPKGDFVMPRRVQTPLIFVAGGIGITPFRSMLSWLEKKGEIRPVKVLYAVSNEDEIILQPSSIKATQDIKVLVSRSSPEWLGATGYLTPELIMGSEKLSDDTLIYISGPSVMVEHLQKGLQEAGVKKKQLVLDFFPGYISG